MITFILCASVWILTLTSAFPTGASRQACSTMTPIHRSAQPQQLEESPYTVEVAPTANLNRFAVTVTSNETLFRGLLLQARSTIDGDSEGTWDTPNDVNFRLIECHGNAAGTVTHANREDKTAPIEFIWTAPDSATAVNYVIYATVVRELETFYVRIPSPPIVGLPTPLPPVHPTGPGVETTKKADGTGIPRQAAVAFKSSFGLAVLLVAVVQWLRRFFA